MPVPRASQDRGDAAPGEEATSSVRPYAVTGGRTAPSAADLPLEALVQALGPAGRGMTPEKRRILELTAAGYLSVAELSAHVRLPVPVVRVVLGDLLRAGAVRVHPPASLLPASAPGRPPVDGWSSASPLSVLESVLDGISTL
jgi:Protein of unknown function (DUF742)